MLLRSVLSIIVVLVFASNSAATLLNGGFESGDLRNWVATASGGTYYDENGDIVEGGYPYPVFTNPWIHRPSVVQESYHGALTAVEGDNFLQIWSEQAHVEVPFEAPDGSVWTWESSGEEYVISVSQSIYLNRGDELSGWMAFFTRDYEPFDYDCAWVEIDGWYSNERIFELGISDAYEDNILPDIYDYAHTSWQQWEWVAPESDTYLLSFNVRGDDMLQSAGYFDGITVTPVPEPSAIVLMGLGLAGLAGYSRKKFNK